MNQFHEQNQTYIQCGNYTKPRTIKFSKEEDIRLKILYLQFGGHKWNIISLHMNGRTPRQCRDRWKHYLSPETNTAKWTKEEDEFLIQKFKEFGKKWSLLSKFFPGRQGTAIRNRCCKLARQIDADEFLKQEMNESKSFICMNDFNNEIKNTENKTKLPSCLSLLENYSHSSIPQNQLPTQIRQKEIMNHVPPPIL